MIKKYNGIIVPMVTPVTKERKLDEPSLIRICQYLAKHDVSILLLGTTGESPSISSKVSRQIVRIAANAVAGKVKLYAGISGNCIEENFENAKQYIELGADVIVSVLPNYYPLTPVQMLNYFKYLADGINFPTMIYNIPSTTNISIPLHVVQELSKHPNICGFKDSERDVQRMEESVSMFRNRNDFSYFIGYAAISAASLKLGADGIVPSTANLAPGMYSQLYKFSSAGQWDEVERLQRETDEIAQIYQAGRTLGDSLQALKVMMSAIDLCQPFAIPPLSDLSFNDQDNILTATRNIINKYKI